MATTRPEVERIHLPTEACGFRVGDVGSGRPWLYILDSEVDDAMVGGLYPGRYCKLQVGML